MVRPSAGQDLQWLVRADCAIDQDVVAQILSERLCGSVSARTVEACDPRDDCYRRMALVRVSATCAGAIAALVVAGQCLRVAGKAVTILPFTHVRQQIHRIPTAPTIAEQLHGSVPKCRVMWVTSLHGGGNFHHVRHDQHKSLLTWVSLVCPPF